METSATGSVPRGEGTTGVVAEARDLIASGDARRAIRRLRDALDRDPDPAGAIELRTALVTALVTEGRDGEAVPVLEALLGDGRLDRRDHARLTAVHTTLRAELGHVDGRSAATEVVLGGRRVRDAATLTHALTALGKTRYYAGDLLGSVAAAEEALRWSGEASVSPEVRNGARVTLGMATLHADDVGRAEALLEEAVHAGPTEIFALDATLALGALRFHEGRWDDAEPRLRELLPAGSGPDWARELAVGLLSVIAVHRDRIDEARRILDSLPGVSAAGPRPMQLWATALLAEAEDRPEEAAAAAERLVVLTRDVGMPIRYRVYGPDVVRILVAADDPASCREVADGLTRVASVAGVRSLTAAARLCRGLADRDLAALAESVELHASGPRVLDAAQAAEALAAALAGTACPTTADAGSHAGPADDGPTDGASDARRAADAATRSLAGYARVGAWRDVARLERLLRRLGRNPGRRGRRPRSSRGWGALSPTELRVAGLVARGLSNAAIGQELDMSPRTVETHLAHLFAKLDVGSRAAVAAEAARHP